MTLANEKQPTNYILEVYALLNQNMVTFCICSASRGKNQHATGTYPKTTYCKGQDDGLLTHIVNFS